MRWRRGPSSIGRLYLPAGVDLRKMLPVVVFFHGGAFMVHTTASPLYHIYSTSLAAAAPAVVVSIDYSLAPEQRIPAAYNDAFAFLKVVIAASHAEGAEAEAEPLLAAHGNASRIVLAGDSAGGNMAHNVEIMLELFQIHCKI
jgi:acetyl esterase/lipase